MLSTALACNALDGRHRTTLKALSELLDDWTRTDDACYIHSAKKNNCKITLLNIKIPLG